jgi:hypothetical protein
MERKQVSVLKDEKENIEARIYEHSDGLGLYTYEIADSRSGEVICIRPPFSYFLQEACENAARKAIERLKNGEIRIGPQRDLDEH